MKYALVIGNSKYSDPKLAQLKTPEADSRALARVLKAKRIGNFDEVTLMIDQTESKSRRSISNFLTNKKPDDLVLIYFSGHGVLDDRGSLFMALKDTQISSLNATAISSSFISYEMDNCRSRRQILILDCCNSGAFARGIKGTQKAITESTFEGNGSGRVVLTASDSTQFAFEGDRIMTQTDFSLFTHFLLEGLKTGEADRDNDGKVSLDEWYDYCHARITATTPQQIPHKWSYHQQGDLIIAQNPFAKKKLGAQRQPKSLQLRAMLDQKQLDYRQHKLLLDSKELSIIAAGLESTKLELQEADKRVILLSAVVYDIGRKWLAICGTNGLEWLRLAYRDESCPPEVRLGAVRCLGEMEDEQTYRHLLQVIEQSAQPSKRGIWLDLLSQYLNNSVQRHTLTLSMKRYVFPRLIKIKVQENAGERAQIGPGSAIVGFICSFITYFLAQPELTAAQILIATFYSALGGVLAFVFAQVLTFGILVTRRWIFPWQVLALTGVGSMAGAGIFFSITGHVQTWFLGGIIGISQAILSRVKDNIPAFVTIILTIVFVFVYSLIILAEIPEQKSLLGYAVSASLFSGVYLYLVFRVKMHSEDQINN